MRLSDFRVLTFDCYGTLIDWETGLFCALEPLLRKSPRPLSQDDALKEFGLHEHAQERDTPDMPYPDLLSQVHRRLAREWGAPSSDDEHARFGQSVRDWPAFPDSLAALKYLKQHYELVILSNVDRASFKASQEKLGVEFDAVITAQDVGSYKPDPRNFRYLINKLAERGTSAGDILHVAQSLLHDHLPANAAGLASVWIDRPHNATAAPPSMPKYNFKFPSLAAMVDAHRAESSVSRLGTAAR
jgi:2-haloacid dehalogenase